MGRTLSNKALNRVGRKAGIKVEKPQTDMSLIREFMKEAGLKGNPNKYVILSARVPPTIISRGNRYVIEGADWSDVEIPKLIHKRELKNYMSKEHAKVFWRNGCVTKK